MFQFHRKQQVSLLPKIHQSPCKTTPSKHNVQNRRWQYTSAIYHVVELRPTHHLCDLLSRGRRLLLLHSITTDGIGRIVRRDRRTGGPEGRWRNSSGWLSNDHICTWFGVECQWTSVTAEGKVRRRLEDWGDWGQDFFFGEEPNDEDNEAIVTGLALGTQSNHLARVMLTE
jgi:hypothetical protein